MRIVWDLDGVLRDLNGYIMKLHGGGYPDCWNFINGSGKNVVDTINSNLKILEDAPPTAYLSAMKKHEDTPEIWTSQLPHWQERTERWIEKYIGKCNIVFIRPEDKETRLYSSNDLVLIEDSPNFKNYTKILLIDRPYNQGVSAMRVYGTKNLNNMIEILKGA